jgi:DNA polymerase
MSDARDELRELSAGLAAHAQRLRRRGARRTAAPLAAGGTRENAPKAPVSVASGGAQPALPERKLHDARTREMFAVARPAMLATPKPAASAAPQTAPTLAAAALAAQEIRAKAAQCPDLASLRVAVAACTSCSLCQTRTQTVFADGSPRARVMFIGEGPGENEDRQGVPFVGRAGQLLTDIIEKGMGLPRAQVYIANVVKCRPPNNRDPSELEKLMCTPWLDRQIELLAPEVIIPLGRHAANHVLGLSGPQALSMGALRGKVHNRGGRKIVPTFHPAYLLRSPGEKKECWKDIQLAMGLLGLKPPRNPGVG